MTEQLVPAIVTAAAAVVAAGMAAWVRIYLARHVGSSNGHGKLNEQVAQVLEASIRHDVRDEARFFVLFTELGLRDPLPTNVVDVDPPYVYTTNRQVINDPGQGADT